MPELLQARAQAQTEFLHQCSASMTVSTTLSRVLDWTGENTVRSSSLWLVYSTKRAIIIVLWMIQQLKFDPCASAHASEIVTGKGRKGLVTPLDDGRLFTYTDLLKCLSKFSFYCDNSFKYISKLNHCRFSINYYCGIKMWVNRRRTCQTRWGSYPLNSRTLFRTVPISGVVNCLFICHQDLNPVSFSGTVCIAMKRS